MERLHRIHTVSEEKLQVDQDDDHFAIVDSGANATIFSSNHQDMFRNIYEFHSRVTVANDEDMHGEWAADQGLLREVLFHDVSTNLISASSLVDEGCRVVLDKESTISNGNLHMILKKVKGLYYLTKDQTITLMNTKSVFAGSTIKQKSITRTPAVVRVPPWYGRKSKLKENLDRSRVTEEPQEKSTQSEGTQEGEEWTIDQLNFEFDNGDSEQIPPKLCETKEMKDVETQVDTKKFIDATTQTSEYFNKLYRNKNPGNADPDIRDKMIELMNDPTFRVHQDMGHASLWVMKSMAHMIPDKRLRKMVKNKKKLICPVCLAGKIKVKNRGGVTKNRANVPFEKIAIDWVAKNEFLEMTGEKDNLAKGFFIAVDYCSDYTMVYPSLSKEDAPAAMDYFIQQILKLGLRLNEVRTDAGTEFANKNFAKVLNPYSVAHTTAAPGQQWQNGKAESRVKAVMQMARCLLIDAGLPEDLWISAARHASFILNNTVVMSTKKTPMQMLGLRNVDLSAVPIFGELGIARITAVTGNAQPRGEACIFLTILDEAEGRFLVMLKASGRVVKRENVVFLGDISEEDSETIVTQASVHIARAQTSKVEDMTSEGDPKSIKAALRSSEAKEWMEALKAEAANLLAHNTLEPMETYIKCKILRSFVILKKALKNNGKIKHKARIVVLGNLQEINSEESMYAPTCSLSVNLLLDNVAINFKYRIAVMDIAAAFLKGRNNREEYVAVQPEFAELLGGGKGKNVFKIVGNLYGTRQAPSIWYNTFAKTLQELGFRRNDSSLTLFSRGTFNKPDSIIISVYVDDLKVLYKSEKEVVKFFNQIEKVYSNTNFERNFERFLGISYSFSKGTIALDHELYITSNIEKECQYIEGQDYKLPKLKPLENNSDKPDMKTCLRLAGLIRFIADRARPDVLFHVNEITSGRYQEPLKMLKSVGKYLVATKSRKCFFRKAQKFEITGYCDASHIRDGDAKSRLAVALFCNENSAPFFSFSSKSSEHFTTISVSSCEAEVKAVYEATVAVEYFLNILKSLGVILESIPVIYCDNLSAVTIINNGEGNSKLRHINTRILYIHNLIKENVLKVTKVDTKLNKVDFLTKYFPSNSFEEAAAKLMGHL